MHITYIYISRSGVESSFCKPYTCFQQRRIQNPFKHLRWSAFAYPVNNFKLLTVYAKIPLLDVSSVSDCACVQIAPSYVLCHLSKHLMGHIEFLNGSRIICLSLNISEKLH